MRQWAPREWVPKGMTKQARISHASLNVQGGSALPWPPSRIPRPSVLCSSLSTHYHLKSNRRLFHSQASLPTPSKPKTAAQWIQGTFLHSPKLRSSWARYDPGPWCHVTTVSVHLQPLLCPWTLRDVMYTACSRNLHSEVAAWQDTYVETQHK